MFRDEVAYRRRRAFSLVELIVSMAIMSVLAVGISSAVLVSTRAIEQTDGLSARVRSAAGFSQELGAEIETAVDVPERDATAVTLAVPDRDGDGSSEQIRYNWSGVSGTPLYRTYNSGTAVAILESVYAFALDYDFVEITVGDADDTESLVAAHESSNDLSNFKVGNVKLLSQRFLPELPAGATGWRVSRIALYGKQTGDDGGTLYVSLCWPQYNGTPGSVICSASVAESSMASSHGWHSFGMSDCSGYFNPGQPVCIVVGGKVNDSAELKYHDKNVTDANLKFYTSEDAGATWEPRLEEALQFKIYAEVAGFYTHEPATETRLGGVRWQIQVGGDNASRLVGAAQSVNLPE